MLTAEHTPLAWRYDFNHATNPHLMTRLGINSVFNVGAMEWKGHIVLMARVEGWDRKSFFAVAESKTGVDRFEFWDYPVRMPDFEPQETNVYDMRLVRHEDGWIYGLFCAERHDDSKPGDLSAAIARCGIARTRDLVDLGTPARPQDQLAPPAQLRPAPGIRQRQVRLLHAPDDRFRRHRHRRRHRLGLVRRHHQRLDRPGADH